MTLRSSILKKYSYHLHPHLIANKPANPRDSSRLFIYNTVKNRVFFDTFVNLHLHLPNNSFLVFNETKVMPARISLRKITGGKVEMLFLVNKISSHQPHAIQAYADRKINIGDRLYLNSSIFFTVIDQKDKLFTLSFEFSREKLFSLLQQYGSTPLPLYIKNPPLDEKKLRQKYQTIFAKYAGSAAAPTASLHFTKRVFNRLKKQGIPSLFLTLHIGLGTFAPLTDDNLQTRRLHKEFFSISQSNYATIQRWKQQGKKLVAVGTTVTRALETIATSSKKYKLDKNTIGGTTDLFILPPYNFQLVDSLLTNFHLPQSSLLMLVEAFLQFKKAKRGVIELYKIAIANRFRFYSFGDAMLII